MRICGNYSADGCRKTRFTKMKRKFFGGNEYVPVEPGQYEAEVCQRYKGGCPVKVRDVSAAYILKAYQEINRNMKPRDKHELTDDKKTVHSGKCAWKDKEIMLYFTEMNTELPEGFLGTEPESILLVNMKNVGKDYSAMLWYTDNMKISYMAQNSQIVPVGFGIPLNEHAPPIIVATKQNNRWRREIGVSDPITITKEDIEECEEKKITGQQMEGAMDFAKYLQNVYKEVTKADRKK